MKSKFKVGDKVVHGTSENNIGNPDIEEVTGFTTEGRLMLGGKPRTRIYAEECLPAKEGIEKTIGLLQEEIDANRDRIKECEGQIELLKNIKI